jgi:hypothetical protein
MSITNLYTNICKICYNEGTLISCAKCTNKGHVTCLELDQKSICYECVNKTKKINPQCNLCGKTGGLIKNISGDNFAHLFCDKWYKIFSAETRFVQRYKKSGSEYNCICGVKGVIPCCAGRECNRLLHEECILKNNGFLGYVEYGFEHPIDDIYESLGSLCPEHNNNKKYVNMLKNFRALKKKIENGEDFSNLNYKFKRTKSEENKKLNNSFSELIIKKVQIEESESKNVDLVPIPNFNIPISFNVLEENVDSEYENLFQKLKDKHNADKNEIQKLKNENNKLSEELKIAKTNLGSNERIKKLENLVHKLDFMIPLLDTPKLESIRNIVSLIEK